MGKSKSTEGRNTDRNTKIKTLKVVLSNSALRIIAKFRDGKEEVVHLSPAKQKTLCRSIFLEHAKAYHRILECVSSAPMRWTDPHLNKLYLWVLEVIKTSLSTPDLEGFPGGFEPYVDDILPNSGLAYIDWEDIAGDVEGFLGRAQAFVECERLVPLDRESFAYKTFEAKKREAESVIKVFNRYLTVSERIAEDRYRQMIKEQQPSTQTPENSGTNVPAVESASKEPGPKKRSKGMLEKHVEEVYEYMGPKATAPELAEKVNEKHGSKYTPTSASAVSKTKAWGQRHCRSRRKK